MKQEDKEWMLKDLCARLTYEVQGITSEGVISPLLTRGEADWDILTSLNYRIVKHGWKPYLRPMSSMTKKEKKEYDKLRMSFYKNAKDASLVLIDWLNAHHFDYRGLIPMGLALEAFDGMYNI